MIRIFKCFAKLYWPRVNTSVNWYGNFELLTEDNIAFVAIALNCIYNAYIHSLGSLYQFISV